MRTLALLTAAAERVARRLDAAGLAARVLHAEGAAGVVLLVELGASWSAAMHRADAVVNAPGAWPPDVWACNVWAGSCRRSSWQITMKSGPVMPGRS